jgi:hypothetical protein
MPRGGETKGAGPGEEAEDGRKVSWWLGGAGGRQRLGGGPQRPSGPSA